MIRSVLFLGLLALGECENLLGVNYSFGADFHRNFDSKGCGNENQWRLVDYEALNIDLVADSDTGIRAAGVSCATSFPIIFFGGILEFIIYVQVISREFKISIEVFDEFESSIASYRYGLTSETFRQGWQNIYVKVDKRAKGYINIRGRSLDDEIVIIDTFRYTPNDTVADDHDDARLSVSYENEDEAEIIFKYQELSQYEIDEFEGSGSGEEPDAETTENNHSFWTPITIFLVSLGAVTVVALVGVGGYHYGKVRATENATPPISADDIEPPRTITIPRVATTNQNPTRFIRFD